MNTPSQSAPIIDPRILDGCPICRRPVVWIVGSGYKECPRCGLKVRLTK